MSWFQLPRLYIDLETTSAYAEQAWTLQLGTALRDGNTIRTGARWINPGVPVPEDVIKAIRLTPAELAKIAAAPPLTATLHSLQRSLQHRPIVSGYNILAYDSEVLRREFQRAGLPFPERHYLDVMVFARHLIPASAVKSHQLEIVVHYLKIKVDGQAHRADADCAMTDGILNHLIETGHLPDDIDRLFQLQSWLAGFGSFFQTPPNSPVIVNCNTKDRATKAEIVYKGLSLKEVYARDPGFIQWATGKLPPANRRYIQEQLR